MEIIYKGSVLNNQNSIARDPAVWTQVPTGDTINSGIPIYSKKFTNEIPYVGIQGGSGVNLVLCNVTLPMATGIATQPFIGVYSLWDKNKNLIAEDKELSVTWTALNTNTK